MGRAERAFREAFARLKERKPKLLPKGSRVSQNNVAKEAGLDPSALKKARFPALVIEIQRWVDEHPGDTPSSPRQMLLAQRSHTRDLRARTKAIQTQRDDALSLLILAESRIVELTMENEQLKALRSANVEPLRPARGLNRIAAKPRLK
jgi:hypothetical protein